MRIPSSNASSPQADSSRSASIVMGILGVLSLRAAHYNRVLARRACVGEARSASRHGHH